VDNVNDPVNMKLISQISFEYFFSPPRMLIFLQDYGTPLPSQCKSLLLCFISHILEGMVGNPI